MNILGISAFYHDSAAALVQDGRIVAAAQEERFSRQKHDASLPCKAIEYCLAEGGVGKGELDTVVFYDKPITKFERMLKTYFSVAPRGLQPYMLAMPKWLRQKLWIPYAIESALVRLGCGEPGEILFTQHHEAHAASAFLPSPFASAAILTIDGAGEWATSTIGHGRDNRTTLLKELRFPHSLGLLYSALTYFTGFRVNSGEYKLMGLAPYGEPRYVDRMHDNLIDLRDDGSFRLNMDYFGFLDGLRMTNQRFADLFDGPARSPETDITRREMDLAASVQVLTEEIVQRMATTAKELTGEANLCMAGGVALNCVANGKLLRSGLFDDIWIQPAAGDAGGALGAALHIWHQAQDNPRVSSGGDHMQGAYLGPAFDDDEIAEYLDHHGYPYELLSEEAWGPRLAQRIVDEEVIGLFHGRMEFGPRALGNRSIIGDARSPRMQSVMNLKIKYRESFRPFAPSCLESCAESFFELDRPSPYMLLVAPVQESRRLQTDAQRDMPLKERVNVARSDVPAITHVDYSARVQTVSEETNPRYHAIIKAFEELTGYGIIINTSFNVRGEPIVCTPEDAYRCFMRTEMDVLVLGSHLLEKRKQPEWTEGKDWRGTYALD